MTNATPDKMQPDERDIGTSSRLHWQGIAAMALAAALFPVKDAFVKSLSDSVTALEAALVYFTVQAIFAFLWLTFTKSKSKGHIRPPIKPLLLVRSILQVGSIVLFFHSIQNAPLAEAVMLFASNALFVVLFSALLLREPIGFKIIATVIVGFCGVYIVLDPDLQNFADSHLIYALLSSIVFAFYLLATRTLGRLYKPGTTLCVDGLLGLIITIIVLFSSSVLIDQPVHLSKIEYKSFLFLVASGIIGTVSALLVIAAMKNVPASVVAPLGYVEIVSAVIIGAIVFGEIVTTKTIIGCLIILLSSWLSGHWNAEISLEKT